MKTLIFGGRVLTPHRALDGAVLIEDGKIAAVIGENALPKADKYIDAGGKYVSPGFIDIHIHGGGGFEFMDGTPEAFLGAGRFHLRHGTTTLVPTLTSGEDGELLTALDAFKKVKVERTDCPYFPGIHMEGPYFSQEQRGAQDPRFLCEPTPEHYNMLLDHSGDIVRWSSAPELPGALDLGDELKRRGILCAIGHSDAVYQQVKEAFEHGYEHVTHLYSGCSTMRRINAFRYLGVVESSFLIDEMTVEVIADGCHLPPEMLELIFKCKPLDKISLITDAMRCAGMPEGTAQRLGSEKNGMDVIIEDGVAKLPDKSSFAGSVATADRLIRTVHKKAGVPMLEAVRMMTANPARLMKIDRKKGSIVTGMDADICIFDEDINISKVIKGGMEI